MDLIISFSVFEIFLSNYMTIKANMRAQESYQIRFKKKKFVGRGCKKKKKKEECLLIL